MSKGALWHTKLIKGDPINVGDRQFVPVVKVRSALRRQVTFGTNQSSGGGGGLVWLQPVAVIERRTDGSEEQIPIPDPTWTVMRGMLIGAMVLPILHLFFASLAFLWGRRQAK